MMRIKVNGYSVDLVPGKRQDGYSQDHSLYRRKANTWTKTNVDRHIAVVRQGGRLSESRVLKLWRDQKGLDFPSFYLELTTIRALYGSTGTVSNNVWTVFQYLRDSFIGARIEDPANTNNVISDDLTQAEKAKVKLFATQVRAPAHREHPDRSNTRVRIPLGPPAARSGFPRSSILPRDAWSTHR